VGATPDGVRVNSWHRWESVFQWRQTAELRGSSWKICRVVSLEADSCSSSACQLEPVWFVLLAPRVASCNNELRS
jgi:hypothetical protein